MFAAVRFEAVQNSGMSSSGASGPVRGLHPGEDRAEVLLDHRFEREAVPGEEVVEVVHVHAAREPRADERDDGVEELGGGGHAGLAARGWIGRMLALYPPRPRGYSDFRLQRGRFAYERVWAGSAELRRDVVSAAKLLSQQGAAIVDAHELQRLHETRQAKGAHFGVAVFGYRKNGEIIRGSGFLVRFSGHAAPRELRPRTQSDGGRHGIRLLRPGTPPSRSSAQKAGIFTRNRRRLLGTELAFDFGRKQFYGADRALLREIGPNETVFAYGFPTGNAHVQTGARFDEEARLAVFTSMTYFSFTQEDMLVRQGRHDIPTRKIYWRQNETISTRE